MRYFENDKNLLYFIKLLFDFFIMLHSPFTLQLAEKQTFMIKKTRKNSLLQKNDLCYENSSCTFLKRYPRINSG